MNLMIIYTSEDKYIAPIFYLTSCYRVYFYWGFGASINLTRELELERHQEPRARRAAVRFLQHFNLQRETSPLQSDPIHQEPRQIVDLDNESRRPLLCLST